MITTLIALVAIFVGFVLGFIVSNTICHKAIEFQNTWGFYTWENKDLKKKILEMRYEDWKNTMPPLKIKDDLEETK